ncbi:hypothetical protein [Streptomyces lacrimifluminis]|uniref:hypothetical protein n=1 Tax=Streptomyces lacrimifluminis TaxID=1500077 RepID=UPI00166E51D0|nr:hypothetical protein [Streptomyces lacrimifluminis]
MILTVTLNTALDITYRVRELRPYASHRVTSVTERAPATRWSPACCRAWSTNSPGPNA